MNVLGRTNLEYIRWLVSKETQISEVYFREYQYPAALPGTPPALRDKLFSLKRREFLKIGDLETRMEELAKNRNIGIESLVRSGRHKFHIPMMDFSLPKNTNSIRLLKKVFGGLISKRFPKGVFFETDNSYHYVGKNLISVHEFIEFLHWSLIATYRKGRKLHENIVDVPFVGYSLIKRSACLRITSYPEKDYLPKAVLLI